MRNGRHVSWNLTILTIVFLYQSVEMIHQNIYFNSHNIHSMFITSTLRYLQMYKMLVGLTSGRVPHRTSLKSCERGIVWSLYIPNESTFLLFKILQHFHKRLKEPKTLLNQNVVYFGSFMKLRYRIRSRTQRTDQVFVL